LISDITTNTCFVVLISSTIIKKNNSAKQQQCNVTEILIHTRNPQKERNSSRTTMSVQQTSCRAPRRSFGLLTSTSWVTHTWAPQIHLTETCPSAFPGQKKSCTG